MALTLQVWTEAEVIMAGKCTRDNQQIRASGSAGVSLSKSPSRV